MFLPPAIRPRRLRRAPWLRRMVQEHMLRVEDLIWPVFVQEGEGQRTAVEAMPGVERLSIDELCKEVSRASSLGIPAIALFPVTPQDKKCPAGAESLNQENLACRAIRAVKALGLDIGIIADVALDPYTSHGHDGLLGDDLDVENDRTVEALCHQAVLLAEAGADIVAPSDMMDGRVAAIREALDEAGFTHVSILAYAAKYASAFYGPFREAVGSAGNLGKADKRTYQMNPANRIEALREVMLDVEEGADMLMIKPGMPYLDIVSEVAESVDIPVLAYQVSGEYAMLKAASANGWLDGDAAMMEALLAFKRAGATAVLTYAALDIAAQLK